MKLWKIGDGPGGWDTYDSAVVAASTKKAARETHPGGPNCTYGWTPPKNVNVEYLGEAKKGTESGVICASFNAG